MVYTKKTLSDCLQSLADRHDNGVLPTAANILSFYTRQLNRGVNYCADKMRLEKEATVTVASGVGNLPDDFLVVNLVMDSDNTILIPVAPDDVYGQVGKTYWITGDHFNGFVLNTNTDGDYTVRYAFKPAEMSANSDVCIIPDIEAPVAYAYAMIRKGESDPFEDSTTSLQECDARLLEMQDAYMLNNNFEGFTVQ